MSGRILDLTGRRFGKLSVVEFVGLNTCHKRVWRCICDCGNEVLVPTGHLNSGHTTSCGCVRNKNKVFVIGDDGLCLTSSSYFWFSLDNLDLVLAHTWISTSQGYVYTTIPPNHRKQLWFHRLVLGEEATLEVDHIDGDVHNNRLSNLRLCTHYQNGQNQAGRGYSYDKKSHKWHAYMGVNGHSIHLGFFSTEEEAKAAVNAARSSWRGSFARIS